MILDDIVAKKKITLENSDYKFDIEYNYVYSNEGKCNIVFV